MESLRSVVNRNPLLPSVGPNEPLQTITSRGSQVRDSIASIGPHQNARAPAAKKHFVNCIKGIIAIPAFIIMIPILFIMILAVAAWSLFKSICLCQSLTPSVKENSVAYFKKLIHHHMNYLRGDARENFRQLLQRDEGPDVLPISVHLFPLFSQLIVAELLSTGVLRNHTAEDLFVNNPLLPLFLKDLPIDKKNQLIILRNYYDSYSDHRARAEFIDNILTDTAPTQEDAREVWNMAKAAMHNVVTVLDFRHMSEASQSFLRETTVH